MRRADERGLRYKFTKLLPAPVLQSGPGTLERHNLARLRTPCNFPSSCSLRPGVTIPAIHWPPVRRLDAMSEHPCAGRGRDRLSSLCAVSRRNAGPALARSFHGGFPDVVMGPRAGGSIRGWRSGPRLKRSARWSGNQRLISNAQRARLRGFPGIGLTTWRPRIIPSAPTSRGHRMQKALSSVHQGARLTIPETLLATVCNP